MAVRIAGRISRGRLAALVLLLCLPIPAFAGPPEVTVVLSEEGGAYAEFGAALRDSLAGKASVRTVAAAGGTVQAPGLVVAVGMKAAAAVAAGDAPYALNVLIPETGYAKLLHDFPNRAQPGTFSAIFLDQPERRQARLVRAVLPGAQVAGLLYSAPQGNLPLFQHQLAAHGLRLHERKVGDSLIEALQDVLQHSDVLLAWPDPEVYNSSTIRNILLTAYNMNVPMIGFSPAYVRAGALCALFSTPKQMAGQAAAAILQFEAAGKLPPPQHPVEFEVMVNEQVARSLGLRIKSPAALHDEVAADEGNEP